MKWTHLDFVYYIIPFGYVYVMTCLFNSGSLLLWFAYFPAVGWINISELILNSLDTSIIVLLPCCQHTVVFNRFTAELLILYPNILHTTDRSCCYVNLDARASTGLMLGSNVFFDWALYLHRTFLLCAHCLTRLTIGRKIHFPKKKKKKKHSLFTNNSVRVLLPGVSPVRQNKGTNAS